MRNQTIGAKLQVAAFIVTLFLGLSCIARQLVYERANSNLPTITRQSLLDGTYMKRVDDAIASAIPQNDTLDGLAAGMEYRSLADAGPQVRAGCPNWLFLDEELVEVQGGERYLAERASIARWYASDLKKRHIRLVMLTVPDKARIEFGELCGRAVSDQQRMRLGRWQALVRGIGALQVPLTTGWPAGETYWRTDTHWNRSGAAFAAGRTADIVRPALASDMPESGKQRRAEKLEPRAGDLMHLSKLAEAPRFLRPAPEFDRSVLVTWQRSGSILDAGPPSDLIVVGSSFSRNSGFIDSLGLDLEHEVVQLSEDGSEFDGAIHDLYAKHPEALATAKVLIWEFPERSLSQELIASDRSILDLVDRSRTRR